MTRTRRRRTRRPPHYAAWRDAVAEMMAQPRASTEILRRLSARQRALGKLTAVAGMPFEFATAGRLIVGPAGPPNCRRCWPGSGRGCWCARAHARRATPGCWPGCNCPPRSSPWRRADDRVGAGGAAAAREHGADVVAAIGGGSVIDLAKAVAMLLGNGGDPLDYLEVVGAGRKITKPAVPLVAVPTTAGTGAEVTANAVLASPAHRVKASLRSRADDPAGRARRSTAHRSPARRRSPRPAGSTRLPSAWSRSSRSGRTR